MSILGRGGKTARDDFRETAKNAVDRFWGVSNGAAGDLAATVECLNECGLSCNEIQELRSTLPVECGGTTGQRVARIDRALKHLEKMSA